jgi:hypothetical protein
VVFTNHKGCKLVGTLVDTGSTEVVMLCHGYLANQEMCQFPLIAAGLAAAGMSSFRFDHSMAFRSKSERLQNSAFQMGNHEEEVADFRQVCAASRACYAEHQPDTGINEHHLQHVTLTPGRDAVDFMRSSHNKAVSCILGHSKGGINIMLFGAHNHDVPKLINLSGRFKVRDGIQQRVRSSSPPLCMYIRSGHWVLLLAGDCCALQVMLSNFPLCKPSLLFPIPHCSLGTTSWSG